MIQRLRNQAAMAAENFQARATFFRPLRTFWAYLTVDSSKCVCWKCGQGEGFEAKEGYNQPCFIWQKKKNPATQNLNICLTHHTLNVIQWREAGHGELETQSMVFEED